LVLVGFMVRLEPSATESMSPALLAAVSGMICLYGLLVDLEMAEHRSMVELISSRERIENEVSRVEDLLHDLRSGLLAIEAAIASFDDELAEPLRAEAARLRRLTLTGARTVTDFNLVDRVESLVASRCAAGIDVCFDGPGTATVWGEESEVLAIVDNLLTNAERHGLAGPIRVEIVADGEVIRLSVENRGELPAGDPEAVFHRGFSTHPDGEGLGLARARMLADINGGGLQVGMAEPGHTCFVLSLKAQAPAPLSVSAPAVAAALAAVGASS
jgi:signal transduction histidine kinase